MIFRYDHTIAGLNFSTLSDVPLRPLQNRNFNPFCRPNQEPDVQHFFLGIPRQDLVMPPLTPLERDRLSRCSFPPYLGWVTQIFPLIADQSIHHKILPYLTDRPVDKFDVPLLLSATVRQRLADCQEHVDQVFLALHNYMVEIRDHRTHRIDVFYTEELSANLGSEYARYGVWRMFQSFLTDFDASMVHASGVIRQNKAVLFLAPDAGGKTTAALQAQPVSILGDDQIILRRQGDGLVAHSTPFGKVINGPLSAPLGAIFLLEKSDHFEILTEKPRRAMEHLWNENHMFMALLPARQRLRAFDLLGVMIHSAPLYRLRSPLNGLDWSAIDHCL